MVAQRRSVHFRLVGLDGIEMGFGVGIALRAESCRIGLLGIEAIFPLGS